jgi:hypothetical protein
MKCCNAEVVVPMRISFYSVLVTMLLFLLSCSWTGAQQEVLDDFENAAGYIESSEWNSAAGTICSSTMLYLDSLAADLKADGLRAYDSGSDLLPFLCEEYIDFTGDVTMIFVQGDSAEVTLSSNESQKYLMIREGGSWCLNLKNIFRSRIDAALTGSYVH